MLYHKDYISFVIQTWGSIPQVVWIGSTADSLDAMLRVVKDRLIELEVNQKRVEAMDIVMAQEVLRQITTGFEQFFVQTLAVDKD